MDKNKVVPPIPAGFEKELLNILCDEPANVHWVFNDKLVRSIVFAHELYTALTSDSPDGGKE